MLFIAEQHYYAPKKGGFHSTKHAFYEIHLSQIMVIMKLLAIFLFAACLQVNARGYSQTVSFTGKNVALSQIFQSIQKQTGYEFFYSLHALDHSSNVTIDLRKTPLTAFLDQCLKDQPLTYTIAGKTIFIRTKEVVVSDFHTDPANTAHPIVEINGRVTNAHGEPLINANIIVKRTRHGTVTDANGNFTLRNINSDDVVSVSFIGYKPQSMPVKDRISLTFVMETTTNELDKVVVQAYGTTSQRLATGNIGTVSAEQIARQPIVNPLEAVQGQIPGVVITNASGYSSGSIKVEIRGRNTIGNQFSTDPLYIIDGVPLTVLNVNTAVADNVTNGSQGSIQTGINSPAMGQSPLFNINPSDIESIEVLKDADATAIYGSRASNGVILITTKRGKPGKTHTEINVYSGYNKVTRYYQMLNTQQYKALREEALANDGLPVDINNAPDLVAWDTARYTNWQKYIWQGVGKVLNTNVSLSGGDTRTTFRLGANYTYGRDILAVSGGNCRGNLSLNINHSSVNQKFKVSWTNFYSISSINLINIAGSVLLPPNAPAVFDKQGNLNYKGWAPLSSYYGFGTLRQPYSSKTTLLNSNIKLAYELVKGLSVSASVGYNNSQTNQLFQVTIASQDPASQPTATAQFGYNNFHNLIVEPQIDYSTFIGKGKLSILAGGTAQTNTTDGVQNLGLNYTSDLLLNSINSAPYQSSIDYNGQYKYTGAYGRINYTLNDKYILNLNGRRDGSSRFGPGRQFGNFGSIGGAWIFSEEKMVKSALPFLSFGKLRGSYGITGGDQISDYQYLPLWQFSNRGNYNGYIPLSPGNLEDSMLQWQVNKKLEISLTLGLLQDRISFAASWYRDRCGNQLLDFLVPDISGFGTVTSNRPANVQNTGVEFLFSAKVVDNKNFKWSEKFTLGINRNKLLSYQNFSQSPYRTTLVIGKSLNLAHYLHSTGVDPKNGQYTFEDKNKDGQITYDPSGNTDDDRFVYDLSPKYEGGFTSDLRYKNFGLSLFFFFRKQPGYGADNATAGNPPGALQNDPVSVLDHWTHPGDIKPYGKVTTQVTDNTNDFFSYSDHNITDASFIRLQNLSASFDLPEKIVKKASIGALRFYIQGENIFLITNTEG